MLAATRLEELQRFPANQEGHTLDAREALKPGSHAVIMLVSHRWLRPNDGEIDDEDRSKLKALLEFVRWYRLKYPAREIYFWIDFCCIAWCVFAFGQFGSSQIKTDGSGTQEQSITWDRGASGLRRCGDRHAVLRDGRLW